MATNPKHQNIKCGGVEIFITDRNKFNSVITGLSILSTMAHLYPNNFKINESGMNRLWGKSNLSTQIKSDLDIKSISQSSNFNQSSKQYLLYD